MGVRHIGRILTYIRLSVDAMTNTAKIEPFRGETPQSDLHERDPADAFHLVVPSLPGGHYAAHQEPDLYTSDVRRFFAGLR